MNPFVAVAEAAVEVVVVAEAEELVVEEVMEDEEVVMEDEEVVMEAVVMEVTEDTVMEVADMVVDIMEDMEEVMGEDGAIGAAGGPSMDGLIAEANPVPIIFSKSLNDPPFSQ